MSIAIFSISDQYLKFHRRPFIKAISEELGNEDTPLLYFKRPKWFLKADSSYKTPEKIGNVQVLPLLTLLPVSWTMNNALARWLTVTLPIKWQVTKAGKRSGSKVSCLWFYKPDQYLYLKGVGVPYAYTHYDNYDDDKEYPFSHYSSYQQTLKACVTNSAACFATSHQLVEKLSKLTSHSNVQYLPNAVGSEWVNAFDRESVSENVIGFVGSIDQSTDERLIEQVCERYPDMTIMMVGKVGNDAITALSHKYSNLTLTGLVPYEQLPNFMSTFKVGICPYRMSPFNQYRNPLKLYEYCAAGIPSVSSQCDFDKEGKRLVHVVETDDEFVDSIGKAIESDTPSTREKRKAFAKQNTWAVRAKEALNYIKAAV
ncbi:putative UDP-Glycosyltransferase/glycogen phosphorylase [Vibrio nigripulchritudo SFn27]|uniref:Putative UDP-Glycosyltransferase/glycogen phosphorylase n=1 Tax=Vibrio nigripulchritudo TaxID=28173 RepID=U4KIV6_9VIBR|nr:glycosyltransferase [Vibrio nigripulchritudo]KJY75106.1 hypothetical protein TW74_17305 [Vibrio nigripulchritudo]CCN82147.1 putative UDP-Glycosyltransferase/glycogen phosphorylase [Vibrio nigripulchritudo BLFn1]CCN86380.1 putative UDP-Glycosyltransferase/glycogen phosphorylase [Vibrio nigripulchritudo SFn27]CCN96768.1 putative UDP-Glycosyltransferase/glycogen phosphorylase [Vibrio nigripulchritudo ENn2]CCO39521.1 putative UDP-Glycosyltransferase/glycogen phosphorylase [Vibrio nigripulchritu